MEDDLKFKRLTRGTLHSLQRLEDMTHNALDEKESVAKQQRELATLQKSLQQIKQQRDRLVYKLEHGPSKILEKALNDENADIEVTSEAHHAAVTSSIAYAKRLKMLEFIQSYRLSGVTVTNVNDKRIRLRWDPFCRGKYHAPYYMELELKNQIEVYRYTVPHFIPVTRIAETYLNEDLTSFVDEIGELLNAYVSRKQQLMHVKKHHVPSIVNDVSSSESLDYIHLSVLSSKDTDAVEIQLYYDDLHASLPTRVCVSKTSGTEGGSASISSKTKHLEDALKQLELPEALTSIAESQSSMGCRN